MENIIEFGIVIPAPTDNECLADYILIWHESPETGFIGVVPIVSHNDHVSFGYDSWREIIARAVRRRKYLTVDIFRVLGNFLALAVDVYILVPQLNCLAGDGDTALDEIFRRILGILEYNYLAGFRVTKTHDKLVRERHPDAVSELNRH